MKQIRVLVVDDSPLVQKFIVNTLNAEKDIEVVDTANDGLIALRKIQVLKPDVVTLDINMPRMNGLATMKEVMKVNPVPIVVFSSANRASADVALKSLSLGAVDFLPKPTSNTASVIQKMKEDLKNKIRAASTVNMKAFKAFNHEGQREETMALDEKIVRKAGAKIKFFCIGASTGGPQALETMLKQIPADFPAYMGIVQHMPDPFINVFAENLDKSVPLKVKIAQNGDIFETGTILMSPGGAHMTALKVGEQVVATIQPFADETKTNYPSVDKFFYSIAKIFRKDTVGVLLTGMGRDGAMGMKAIKTVGGATIAQDESTAVVYGMPKAAIEMKAVDKIAALPYIHALMKRMI
jgi:two-component system chemotaxis response regulator CheB